jgi:hypothetical protein
MSRFGFDGLKAARNPDPHHDAASRRGMRAVKKQNQREGQL